MKIVTRKNIKHFLGKIVIFVFKYIMPSRNDLF